MARGGHRPGAGAKKKYIASQTLDFRAMMKDTPSFEVTPAELKEKIIRFANAVIETQPTAKDVVWMLNKLGPILGKLLPGENTDATSTDGVRGPEIAFSGLPDDDPEESEGVVEGTPVDARDRGST